MRAAASKGLSVIIEQSGDNREVERAVLRRARMPNVDGILYSTRGACGTPIKQCR